MAGVDQFQGSGGPDGLIGGGTRFFRSVSPSSGEAMPHRSRQDACAPGNLGNHAVELLMKHSLRVYEIKFGNCRGSHFNSRQLRAQFFSQAEKYFEDFAEFCFMKRLQFVVGVDRFKRFNEGGRA